MKLKDLWVTALFIVLTLHVYSHEGDPRNMVAGVPFSSQTTLTYFPVFYPLLESILYNPAVHKKQLSRDIVQAVGYRQTTQAHFIIHFRKEELHGVWQSFYNNNQRCDSGQFTRNLPTGEWKTWYPNGQLKTIRTYNAEKYRYIKNDLQRNHPKDQRYAITRQAGKNPERHFQPRYERSSGINGPLTMLQKIRHNATANGSYLAPFSTCLHHGTFVNYHENGSVKDSGHYENGLRHGLWHESVEGSTMQAFGLYRHGVRYGQWKYYDAAGRLVYTERYKANGKRSEWHYFEK
jgi:antitoxin component YwqK of YwqJK toxin-antitoxin module